MHFQFSDNNFIITLSDKLLDYSWTSFPVFPPMVLKQVKKGDISSS